MKIDIAVLASIIIIAILFLPSTIIILSLVDTPLTIALITILLLIQYYMWKKTSENKIIRGSLRETHMGGIITLYTDTSKENTRKMTEKG